MPLDFRYHLASLAAVFGALLIGILLGVAMNEGPGISNQINDLRADFRQSQALRDIDKQTDQFNARTQSLLVRGRLAGSSVLLVRNPTMASDEQVDAVRGILEEAGASITAQVTLKPALSQLTTAQIASIYRRLAPPLPAHPGAPDLMNGLVREFGQDSAPITQSLRQNRLIRVDGNLLKPFSNVVYLGGADKTRDNTLEQVDLPFLRGCIQRKVFVVATEPFEAPTSVIDSYRKAVPLTIDNIDRAAGRITLVLGLASQQHGSYGYKRSADDIAPEIE